MPAVQEQHNKEVDYINHDPSLNRKQKKVKEAELEKKYDYDNYIDSQQCLLRCRRSAFPSFTDKEYFIASELYKMGVSDSYISDVSLGVSDRLNKAQIISSFSSELMKIPVPRPKYHKDLIKKRKNDTDVKMKEFKLKDKNKIKRLKRSSKSKNKDDEILDLSERDIRIAGCADRSVVKFEFTVRV